MPIMHRYITYSALILVAALCHVEAQFESEPCGGHVNKTHGIIKSPGYMNKTYPYNKTCVWVFDGEKNYTYFRVQYSLQPQDTLVFYNGSEGSHIIVSFTGSSDGEEMVISVAPNTTMVLTTAPEVANTTTTGRGFTMHYTNENCTQQITGDTRQLRGPWYVQGAGSFKCYYLVNSSKEDSVLALTFTEMALVKGFLYVYDGISVSAPCLGNYTATSKYTSDVISSGRYLFIKIEMSLAQNDSFQAAVTTVSAECSGMLSLDGPKIITSPGYPETYENDLDCRLVITAPKGMTLLMTLDDLGLNDDLDQLIIIDGPGRKGTQLFKQTGPSVMQSQNDSATVLVTSGESMWLRFSTDDVYTGKGFSMNLMPKAYGGILMDSGVVTYNYSNTSELLPGPPLNLYSHSAVYHLVVKPDHQVMLTFNKDLYLLPTTTFRFYDGATPQENLLAVLRSDLELQPLVVSSGSHMFITISNLLGLSRPSMMHFNFSFTAIPTGKYKNTFGPSDGVYLYMLPGDTVTWQIHPQKGIISISFDQLILGPGSTVTVNEGSGVGSKLLVNLTSDYLPASVIYISGQGGAKVTFTTPKSTSDGSSPLLEATTSFIQVKECKTEVTTDHGQITSPLFPNWYPSNSYCDWHFTPKKMLHLSFQNFKLNPEHSVHVNSVSNQTSHHGNSTVSNMTYTDLGKYSGDAIPDDIITGDQELWVEFHTPKNPQVEQGFSASYELIDCGGNVTETGAKIETPGYPANVSSSTTCVWVITLPPGSNGTVNIVSFQLALSYIPDNTTDQTVEVRDGANSVSKLRSVILTKSGTSFKSSQMLSRQNKLWVKYSFKAGTGNASMPGPALSLDFGVHSCPPAQQCKNGICMHSDWKCNGIDDCGDGSDELNCYNCQQKAKITPLVLGLSILATFCAAIALAFLAPYCYKRCKYPAYQELRDMMTPVPT